MSATIDLTRFPRGSILRLVAQPNALGAWFGVKQDELEIKNSEVAAAAGCRDHYVSMVRRPSDPGPSLATNKGRRLIDFVLDRMRIGNGWRTRTVAAAGLLSLVRARDGSGEDSYDLFEAVAPGIDDRVYRRLMEMLVEAVLEPWPERRLGVRGRPASMRRVSSNQSLRAGRRTVIRACASALITLEEDTVESERRAILSPDFLAEMATLDRRSGLIKLVQRIENWAKDVEEPEAEVTGGNLEEVSLDEITAPEPRLGYEGSEDQVLLH